MRSSGVVVFICSAGVAACSVYEEPVPAGAADGASMDERTADDSSSPMGGDASHEESSVGQPEAASDETPIDASSVDANADDTSLIDTSRPDTSPIDSSRLDAMSEPDVSLCIVDNDA